MAEEQKQEFWRWTESNWKNPEIDWKAAKYITVGIDVGSGTAEEQFNFRAHVDCGNSKI